MIHFPLIAVSSFESQCQVLFEELISQIFVADIHVREPEGDVLIFMTGQVSFFICSI